MKSLLCIFDVALSVETIGSQVYFIRSIVSVSIEGSLDSVLTDPYEILQTRQAGQRMDDFLLSADPKRHRTMSKIPT